MARFVFALSAAAWMATVVTAVEPAVAGRAVPVAQQASPAAQQDGGSRALLDRYCVTCHNQRLKTGGLSLDTVDPANLGEHAETWEKVVRKLRAGTMPPIGRPRPEKPAVASLVSSLELGLDRAAAAKPRTAAIDSTAFNPEESHTARSPPTTVTVTASAPTIKVVSLVRSSTSGESMNMDNSR